MAYVQVWSPRYQNRYCFRTEQIRPEYGITSDWKVAYFWKLSHYCILKASDSLNTVACGILRIQEKSERKLPILEY